MSGFAEFRRNQKSIKENINNETWKKANSELLKKEWVEVIKAESTNTSNLSAADLADIEKENQLDALLINQGVITQETIDGLEKDREGLSKKVTGGKGIISAENQKLLNSKKTKLKGNPAPPNPPVLRYPFEGMTQHTDYLQIDIVEYKPAGREKEVKERGHALPLSPEYMKTKEGAAHAKKLSSKKFISQNATFKGKMGGRRNTNQFKKAGSKRPYGLSVRPIKNEGTILLPIPSNVQDGNSIKVGDNSLNGLQAAGASAIINTMQTDFTSETNITEQFAEVAKDFKGDVVAGANLKQVQNMALSKLTASALGIFGGNITTNQLLARQTGNIINPNMELLFDGPTLRAFKFQFKMTPRNRKEAEQIKLIIRSFKRNMAPIAAGKTTEKKEGAWFLKTPKVFELRYRTGNKDHKYLHKFKQCFLTDIAVNYTGDGVYSTYEDGSPISYLMDLSFKELEPIYDIDYDSEQGRIGVGY